MKHLAIALALLLVVAVRSASAQVTVYGKLDYDHHTDSNDNSAHALFGGGVGVDDVFLHEGPLGIGGDIRGSFQAGDNYRYQSLLLGLPVGLKLPVLPFRPYVEPVIGGGGYEITNLAVGLSSHYTYRLTYGALAGVTCTVLPHIDWRVLEVGYTREKNGSLSNPNVLVSAGLGFRL